LRRLPFRAGADQPSGHPGGRDRHGTDTGPRRREDGSAPVAADDVLAWGQGGTEGGYKIPSLVGLAWTAPHLHDSGVAVGSDTERQLGVSRTLYKGMAPDPANSLRALVDRDLRAKVVAVNAASDTARVARVTGKGHAFWADAGAGVSPDEQAALIAYLLSVDRLQEPAATP
jgi:hypothetical protein